MGKSGTAGTEGTKGTKGTKGSEGTEGTASARSNSSNAADTANAANVGDTESAAWATNADNSADARRIAGMRPRTAARAYFAAQALAGAAWWASVFTVEDVRHATLGDLDPVVVAAFDLPLFVLASALAAFGLRWAACIAAPWTVLVAALMTAYATATQLAGWGAVLMIAAAACSTLAAILLLLGEVPARFVLVGPFAFREARPAASRAHLGRTIAQMLVFWGLFLVVLPMLISWGEDRWRLRLDLPSCVPLVGLVVLVAASALGVWSATSMATRGDGTPLPSATASRLVVAGPYRLVRNPMAVAGIAQAAGVGLMLGSWLVVLYALAGSLLWNWVVRPLEEADLEARFGAEFAAYRDRVACWVPRVPARR